MTEDKKNKSLLNLRPFKKGEDERRNLDGRPKKLINAIADYGYKPSEVIDVLATLLALRVDQLATVTNNNDCTLLERLVAKALIKGLAKGSMFDVNTIIDRIAGLPKQSIEAKQEIDISAFKVEVIHTGVKFANSEAEVDTSRPQPKEDSTTN